MASEMSWKRWHALHVLSRFVAAASQGTLWDCGGDSSGSWVYPWEVEA